MGKLLQRAPKRRSTGTRKKNPTLAKSRGVSKKLPPKPTLRQVNRWMAENSEQIMRKAKQNCLRLTGQETL